MPAAGEFLGASPSLRHRANSSTFSMRRERSCLHLQTSCCTKMECKLCCDPHNRMHESKNCSKVVVPSWATSITVCKAEWGINRLIPKADMISCVSFLSNKARMSFVLTSLSKFSSMLSKSVRSVIRNCSDSAANEASSFSCSPLRKIIRCTITPTIKFTRAKFVKTITPTKYTDHNWLCLMAVPAISGQFSRVTTQKCENRALPRLPKNLSTSGSKPLLGWPMSNTVTMEPV
mmetsp:Transcript_102454/g.306038  ORF Transcript_102454/g.306038 Transcript_102454/m.306038 type:complete len:233 (-) Transcript_102454:634-1332(-)